LTMFQVHRKYKRQDFVSNFNQCKKKKLKQARKK